MSAGRAGPDPVFIVGLYKNGTSWLLAALAAHPDFWSIRELDLLRSIGGRHGRHLLARRKRLANIFGRSAFCALKAEQMAGHAFRSYLPAEEIAPDRARYIDDLDPDLAVRALANMVANTQSREITQAGKFVERTGLPLNFSSFSHAGLVRAFTEVRDCTDIGQGMRGVVDTFAAELPDHGRLVFKGADQILGFDALQKYWPDARKIVIVRDGRDAAISAFHYRKLMLERRLAWRRSFWSLGKPVDIASKYGMSIFAGCRKIMGYGDDWRLARNIRTWRNRVRRVLRYAGRGELYVLRYEDLLLDFENTFSRLVTWLGADNRLETITRVKQACSFESVTGRSRGVAGKSVVRRGEYGVWRQELTKRDQSTAWRIAGSELEALGYGQDGQITGCKLRVPGEDVTG